MSDATAGPASAAAIVETVRAAADTLRERLGAHEPRVAITMGSGLGGLAGAIEGALDIPYEELPGWPRPTVEGHAGRLVAGTLEGVPVLGLSGRVHLYEAGDAVRSAFYVRVLGELGVPILFLSNAAGAIRRAYAPGELMLIADHLNLQFRSPLIGDVVEGETRFTDMSAAYDRSLRASVRAAAWDLEIGLHEGVYAALPGPSYETPAEIRMLKRLGADAVGMSTVAEVLVARARGIRCVAISCLTNYAAGVSARPLRHEEVVETAKRVEGDFQRLVAASVARFEI